MPPHLNAIMTVLLFWAAARTGYRWLAYGVTPLRAAIDASLLATWLLMVWAGVFN